ncbi:MAG TPA: hypothetical protein VHM19_14825 [Polyangiales bacterium]|nr:hypothetical protein [Polyangiales bacterium]
MAAACSCTAVACKDSKGPAFAPGSDSTGDDNDGGLVHGPRGGGSVGGGSSKSDGGTGTGSGTASGSAAGTFDPAQVYIVGRLDGRPCSVAFGRVDAASDVVVGAPCGVTPTLIDPATRAPLYGLGGEYYELACDNDCHAWRRGDDYPADPSSNDTKLKWPKGCDSGAKLVIAANGQRVYDCGGGALENESGAELKGTLGLLPCLAGDLISFAGDSVVDLHTGKSTVLSSLLSGRVVACRGRSDGFRLLVETPELIEELWSVSLDGVPKRIGSYPPLSGESADANAQRTLDASGALYGISFTASTVVRRTTSGDSELVWRGTSSPFDATSDLRLFTGP